MFMNALSRRGYPAPLCRAGRGGRHRLTLRRAAGLRRGDCGKKQKQPFRGEIIKEFLIPADDGRISAFLKIGSRSQVSISRINIAVSVRRENGLYKEARV